jgi:hypothetical protein
MSSPYAITGERPPLAALARLATAWRPEAGDQIDGTILAIIKRTSEFGIYPAMLIEVETIDTNGVIGTGVQLMHCFHEVLKNQLIEMRPKAGERISCLYIGETKNKKTEQTYHNYVLWRTHDGDGVEVFDFGRNPAEPEF